MLNKFHILLIILTLGFFGTPTLTYACGTKTTKTEKSCCKKSENEKDNKIDCCKKNHSQSDKGCEGKCKHSFCHCLIVSFAFTLPFLAELRIETYFSLNKELKFYDKEANLSSGFYSIWLPPKIR